LLQDDFNVRLEHEVREATERTRKMLGMSPLEQSHLSAPTSSSTNNNNFDDLVSKKHEADNRNIELAYKTEQLESQLKETIALSERSLVILKKTMERKSVENMHALVKSLINQAFKSFRVSFSEEESYEPDHILGVIKEVLIGGTLSSLPEIPEEVNEEDESFLTSQQQKQQQQYSQINSSSSPSSNSNTNNNNPGLIQKIETQTIAIERNNNNQEIETKTQQQQQQQSISSQNFNEEEEDFDNEDNERERNEEEEKEKEAQKFKQMLQEKQRLEELKRQEEEEEKLKEEKSKSASNQPTKITPSKKVWEDDLDDESFFSSDTYDDGLGITRKKSTSKTNDSSKSAGFTEGIFAKKEEKKSIFDNDDDDDDLWG